MMKKAQFSIDYVTTYSLALFAFLIVLVILFNVYVGPDIFIKDECKFLDALECVDGVVQNGEITISLRNNLPDAINITKFLCFQEDESNLSTQYLEISANSVFELNCNLLSLDRGRKVKINFVITYIEEDKFFLKSTTGTLITTNRE